MLHDSLMASTRAQVLYTGQKFPIGKNAPYGNRSLVEPGIVEATSDATTHRCSKNQLNPHQNRYWVMPPKAIAAFEAVLEDVPEVYTRPHDPVRPLVCLDETTRQLTCETRTAIPARPSRAA